MHRLTLFALVLAGLAALWLAAPAYAKSPAPLEMVAVLICVEASDLLVASADPFAGQPHLKACAGQKNRLAIPCQTDRCLPVEPTALPFRPQERHFLPLRAQAMPERNDPDGQFRPPRLAA